MVIGDVVSALAADNAALTFIPAAGVEVLLTYFVNLNSGAGATINYLNAAGDRGEASTSGLGNNLGNLKMFLNNAQHLQLLANGAGVHVGFGGIQTNE